MTVSGEECPEGDGIEVRSRVEGGGCRHGLQSLGTTKPSLRATGMRNCTLLSAPMSEPAAVAILQSQVLGSYNPAPTSLTHLPFQVLEPPAEPEPEEGEEGEEEAAEEQPEEAEPEAAEEGGEEGEAEGEEGAEGAEGGEGEPAAEAGEKLLLTLAPLLPLLSLSLPLRRSAGLQGHTPLLPCSCTNAAQHTSHCWMFCRAGTRCAQASGAHQALQCVPPEAPGALSCLSDQPQ